MNAWACSVLAALETQLDTIRHGTPLRPAGGIPYTSHNRRDMHRFLEGFVGHGVVCSTSARRISQSSAMTRRYIDDLSSINSPNLQHLMYNDMVYYGETHGIYPLSLLLKKMQDGTSVDITICPSGRGHRLTTVLYGKREHPPLSSQFIVTYPHAF